MFLLISFAPLLFFFSTVVVSTQDYYQRDRETKLLQYANIIADSISKAGYLYDETNRAAFDGEIADKSKEGSFRVLVLDGRGVVVNDTNMAETGHMIVVPEVIYALQKSGRVSTRENERTIYAASSITNEQSEKIGAVLLVASAEDIFEAVGEIQSKILLFIIVALIIIIVLVFFISQLLLDPIHNFLKVAQKISDGNLNERISVRGHDEFTEIAQAFNTMAGKIEQAEKTREEFVSNVSHELKTPLSSIKVLTESILLEENVPTEMYTEFLQDMNSEIDRMTNIINDLLNLVKLDQREVPLNVKQTDVNKVIEEILKRLSPIAERKSIELLYEAVRSVNIMADEMKLSLAITNLIENGIKYTPENGTVKVVVDADHQNAFITVQDTGIGIGEEELGKIFNRFYRVDKTRDRETGGTGLGLSITHSTMLLHKGSIKVTSKENEGTTFVMRLPIHRSM